MTYRHHYPMLIEIENMLEDGTVGLTPAKLSDALRRMADKIDQTPDMDLKPILGSGPINVDREDRWVLREASLKGTFRRADGKWAECKSANIKIEDTMTGREAASFMREKLRFDLVFVCVRPENVSGHPLVAKFTTPNADMRIGMDVRDFLASGDEDLVVQMARNDWRLENASDVLEIMFEEDEPAAIAALDQINASRNPPVVSFEISDKERAMAFLKECRPDLHDRVVGDAAPSPI